MASKAAKTIMDLMMRRTRFKTRDRRRIAQRRRQIERAVRYIYPSADDKSQEDCTFVIFVSPTEAKIVRFEYESGLGENIGAIEQKWFVRRRRASQHPRNYRQRGALCSCSLPFLAEGR